MAESSQQNRQSEDNTHNSRPNTGSNAKRKAKKKARHLTKKQEEVQKQETRKQGIGEELTLSERENIRSDPVISDIELVASEPEDTPWRPKDASDPSSTSVVFLGLAKSNVGGGGEQQLQEN